MEYKAQLQQYLGSWNTKRVVSSVGSDPVKFDMLISFMKGDDKQVAARAAHAVTHCFKADPAIVDPYLNDFIDLMLIPDQQDGIVRNVLRTLQFTEIPEDKMGEVLERCFELIISEKAAVALRAFSITVAYRITNYYPELKKELKLVLDDLVDHSSPAIRSRGGKTHKKLIKELKR